jgi:hypothetical protein
MSWRQLAGELIAALVMGSPVPAVAQSCPAVTEVHKVGSQDHCKQV